MNSKTEKGTITETPSQENGWFYVVDTDDGNRRFLQGIGAPKEGEVGDRGTLKYTTGAGFGLWFWTKDES